MKETKTNRKLRHDKNLPYEKKLDAFLSEERKKWLYAKCRNELSGMLFRKHGCTKYDVEDITSKVYYDIVDRCVEDVFPKGIPTADAEWMAFLKAELRFAYLSHFRDGWRHPTVSLSEPVSSDGFDDDGDDITLEDTLVSPYDEYDTDVGITDYEDVHYAVESLCKKHHYDDRKCKAVKRTFLDGDSVSEIADDDFNANNVSVTKHRFNKILLDEGLGALEGAYWMRRCG